MAEHNEVCHGCHRLTMRVFELEDKDVFYCGECAFEGDRPLKQPRKMVAAETSPKRKYPKPDRERR